MARSELEIIVGLTDNTKRGLTSITGALGKLGGLAAGAALGGVTALAGGLTALAATSIPAASNLEESINKVEVVFDEAADEVRQFAATAATSLGQSQAQALEAAGTYGNLLTSIGLTTDKAADMSIEMVQLASDLASFNNASPEETLLALRSALTGEFEPMKRFGTALNQAAVEAKALELGLIANKNELTPAIKAQAAYALILEQTSNAQGDFARTSEGLANAQRIVKAQIEDLRAQIGSFLLPVAQKFFGFLSRTALPTLNTFARYIGFVVQEGDYLNDFLVDIPERIRPIVELIGRVVAAFRDFVVGLASGEDPVGDFANLIYYLGLAFGATEDQLSGVVLTVRNVVDTITALLDTVRAALAPVFEWIRQNIELKDVLIALGIIIGGVLVSAIASLLASIAPVVLAFAGLIAVVALLRRAWEENFLNIQEHVQNVIRTARSLFEIVRLLMTGDFRGGIFGLFEDDALITALFNIRENLILAGQAVMTLAGQFRAFVTDTVAPFIAEHGDQLVGILAGIVAGLAAFSIITTVVGWITGLIAAVSAASTAIGAAGGIIATVVAILGGPLTIAIAAVAALIALFVAAWINDWGNIRQTTAAVVNAVSGFWNNILLPALQGIWDFLSVDMMPVWEALWELLQVTGAVVLEALAALWENVLLPALDGIWGFIKNNILPIFTRLWDFIRNNIIPVFDEFSNSVGGLSGIIQSVVGWITSLANAIRNLPDQLPPWLRRESPSPFELVFINTEDAIKGVTKELPRLKSMLSFSLGNIGVLASSISPAVTAVAPMEGGNTYITNNNTYNEHYYNEATVALRKAQVNQFRKQRLGASMGA